MTSADGSLNRFSMTDRVVLVTGASRGLGSALALGFAQAGADVAINYRSHDDEAAEVVQRIQQTTGRRAIAARADVADPEAARAMVTEIGEQLGPIDALVCCAGVPGNHTPSVDVDMDDWHRVLRVHLDGTFLCAREVVKQHMGPRKAGSIIAIGSIGGLVFVRGGLSTAYRTAKGGVHMMARNLAMEWVESGVRVNTIIPGFFATDSLDVFGPDFGPGHPMFDVIVGNTPMARIAHPDELVGPALFLASDASSYVTGTTLTVDGGYTAW